MLHFLVLKHASLWTTCVVTNDDDDATKIILDNLLVEPMQDCASMVDIFVSIDSIVS